MTTPYNRQLLQVVNDYRAAGGAWPAKSSEIAEWALTHRRWEPSHEDMRRVCAESLAEAMREETFVDERGRVVRSKVPATMKRDGEQGTFWDDLRTAPVEHVQISVAQRRKSIVSECSHLSNIVQYFNEHHGATEQIQLILDFSRDVAEIDALARPVRGAAPAAATTDDESSSPALRVAPGTPRARTGNPSLMPTPSGTKRQRRSAAPPSST